MLKFSHYHYHLFSFRLIRDLELFVLKFTTFGQTFIKEQHISPDVFIQLALQLTYYKLHRRLVSTYESCSLRQFRKGRVDNIRASSKEALLWAQTMCSSYNAIPVSVCEMIERKRKIRGRHWHNSTLAWVFQFQLPFGNFVFVCCLHFVFMSLSLSLSLSL